MATGKIVKNQEWKDSQLTVSSSTCIFFLLSFSLLSPFLYLIWDLLKYDGISSVFCCLLRREFVINFIYSQIEQNCLIY